MVQWREGDCLDCPTLGLFPSELAAMAMPPPAGYRPARISARVLHETPNEAPLWLFAAHRYIGRAWAHLCRDDYSSDGAA